ncbi:LysM peptidoglycan-binding domain-containing protein [Cellulosimicrobium composti]|uniref:LysM peptidoglycan-binding domain-containing protein n=1 Tax=Cellulosimicrobium composti TaxID=2672572 RepID=UPI00379DE723
MQAVGIMAGPVALASGRTERARRDEAPLRLTRRGRVVLVLLAALVLVLAARVGVAVASGPGEPVEVRVHVVSSGETLWELAQGVAAPGEDLRDVVSGLVELNGLSSSGVQAGQKLLLPVEEG